MNINEDSNTHEGCNQEIGDLKSIIDKRDEEIKFLNDIIQHHIKDNTKLIKNMKSIREENDRIIALKENEIIKEKTDKTTYEARYRMLEERYKENRHFTDYCELYFVDEPYPKEDKR